MKRIFTLLLFALAAFSFPSKAQSGTVCNADFSFQYLTANNIKFIPVVIGDSFNTQHYWKFGDGSVANTPLPIHLYTAPGTYSVTHVIIKHNNNGTVLCADTTIKQLVIQSVACNLQAYFTFHADSANFLKIHFANATVTASPSDSLRWTFGDGTSLSGLASNPAISNPTHVYANAGTYNTCLRVKRNNNTGTTPCVSEICKTVVVTQPCNLVANFTSVPDPNHPLRIKFTNTSTPIAVTDSVRWTFGDGTSVSGVQADPNVANPTHNYTQGGTYVVCLRIKKNISATNTPCVREICKTITVQSPCNIQVNFTMHRDSLSPRKVYFNNQTIVTTTNAIAKWSFGDGTYAGTWNAVHEYAQPGTYRVCLTIQTEPNCVREKCDTIIIPATAPSCKDLSVFKFEKFSNDNQKYKFIPQHILNDVQYTWTFGDGTGSHDPIATHRYAQPGIYTACLTAWRGPNCASTTCKEIRVLPQINCDSIHVSYNYQRDPLVPNKIYFYANGNYPILDQTWTITRLAPATTPPVILHQNNPVYVFNDTGYYRVCLKAITLGGCVKEYCSVIRIEHVLNNACLLQAYPNPATTVVNVNVQLSLPGVIDAYVYNAMNVLVKEKHQAGVAGNNIVSININDLTAGLYTMKVKYGGKICYARFTKL